MKYLKNKILLTLSFSLGLTAGHFAMAEAVSPQNELASLNTEPCALSEETIEEEITSSLDERLYEAVRNNDVEEAKRLIGEGADPSFQSVMRFAILKKYLEIVALLIENGADLEAAGDYGTPLYIAIMMGRPEAARLLIEGGANVNVTNFRSYTPLHELVCRDTATGDLSGCSSEAIFNMVKLLIENGADVNAKDDKGLTPLHEAYTCDVRIAKLLIEHGANVNAKYHGRAPLHFAASRPLQFRYVKLLLDSGADVNALDGDRNTPLHLAISWRYGTDRVQRLLIASGADMHVVNRRGETPLGLLQEKAAEKAAENAAENASVNEEKSNGIYEYLESLKVWFFGEPMCELNTEPMCELNTEPEKYLDWNKLSYFEGKPKGISYGSVILDQNGAIWYVKHPAFESGYAKEYLCGKLLQLILSTNISGNHFSEVKLVKNHEWLTLASKVIPGFQGLVDYAELEDPVGAELVALVMFLIRHADGHANNVGVVLSEEGEAEMALIDYDQSMALDSKPVDADMFDQDKENLSELLVRRFYYEFMSGHGVDLNGEALQDAAAVIAGIAREDIIQAFADGHKDILEMGVSIDESEINAWRDALLERYDIICAMAEKMDYFTLVK